MTARERKKSSKFLYILAKFCTFPVNLTAFLTENSDLGDFEVFDIWDFQTFPSLWQPSESFKIKLAKNFGVDVRN